MLKILDELDLNSPNKINMSKTALQKLLKTNMNIYKWEIKEVWELEEKKNHEKSKFIEKPEKKEKEGKKRELEEAKS